MYSNFEVDRDATISVNELNTKRGTEEVIIAPVKTQLTTKPVGRKKIAVWMRKGSKSLFHSKIKLLTTEGCKAFEGKGFGGLEVI